jgi:hypothetical protein
MIDALVDPKMSRRHLEDIGAAVLVEDVIRPTQKMRKGLTVVTVADQARPIIARQIMSPAAEGAAGASDGKRPRLIAADLHDGPTACP